MKCSELIAYLATTIKDCGDVNVVVVDKNGYKRIVDITQTHTGEFLREEDIYSCNAEY